MKITHHSNTLTRIRHPFLFALSPLVFFWGTELSLLERQATKRLLLPAIVLIVCTGGLFALSRIIMKDKAKTSILVTLLVALIFRYGYFYTLILEKCRTQVLLSLGHFTFGYNKLSYRT